MKATVTHGIDPMENKGATTRVDDYPDAAISVGEDGDLVVIATGDQTVIDSFDPGTWSHAEVMP